MKMFANKNNKNKKFSKGFTLIEVLFALVVASISLSAISYAINSYFYSVSQNNEKTITSWAALNRIVAVKYTSLKVAQDEETQEMFGQKIVTKVNNLPSQTSGLEIIEVLVFANAKKDHTTRMISLKSTLAK